MNFVDSFIGQLARTPVGPLAFNQYAYDSPENAVRRDNLRRYLQEMEAFHPRILLVGEAPGYRGCRITGVPFTSPSLLIQGVEGLGLFGIHRGYRIPEELKGIRGESTATILWQTLASLQTIPLLWNAFPFHPHLKGNPHSNRSPTQGELEVGKYFLQQIWLYFQPLKVIAVGNVAERVLMEGGIPCFKVRHPAQGGKRQFVIGLQSAVRTELFPK